MSLIKKFPEILQLDTNDCGPTSLMIVAQHYGKNVDQDVLREVCNSESIGISLTSLEEGAEHIGFDYSSVQLTFQELKEKAPLPCICHWEQNHFLVVYRISAKWVYLSDPANGLVKLNHKEFLKGWAIDTGSEPAGIAMLLEPNELFEQKEFGSKEREALSPIRFILKTALRNKRLLASIVFGLLISGVLQILLPVMTQSIVDQGIQARDYNLIVLIIVGQLFFIVVGFFIEIIRNWMLLFLSQKINIQLMSGYISKLMALPISFIQRRSKGDILTRINDNERIEQFLSGNMVELVFDVFVIAIFSVLLLFYDPTIFLIFLVGGLLYVGWVSFFLKKRGLLDKEYFRKRTKSQNLELQIVNNISEIKTNDSSQRRHKEWYQQQMELVRTKTKSLRLQNLQMNAGELIRNGMNILILFVSAGLVVKGEMTLGAMLAVQYIIAQLNLPLNRLTTFFLEYQDAKLSMNRLFEVLKESPENENKNDYYPSKENTAIVLKDVAFSYLGKGHEIFHGLNLTIPKGKFTAIVGPSGSGKTTLFNLLLGFRFPSNGSIHIAGQNVQHLDLSQWRNRVGVVLQDGRIFNDTIEKNITESSSNKRIDKEMFLKSVRTANLEGLIDVLPNGRMTKIGDEGIKLSGGEKQKLLLARAIYKNPEYFFLDEPTSAMDTINEGKIKENLSGLFKDRTVIMIAHRLSTVMNADNIIVLDQGKVVETGNHEQLISKNGVYAKLLSNQISYAQV